VTDLTRLLLIRHGDCNQTATEPDPGLSGLGHMQCELLRDRLMATGEVDRASVLLVSPLRRAVESAEILRGALEVPASDVIVYEGLREMSWGKAEGWRWEDLVATYGEPAGPHAAFAPNGESWTSFVRRGRGALSRIVRQYAGSNIIAVTHTGIIEASFILFASLSKRIHRFEMKPFNTGLSSWASQAGSSAGRWRLEAYNDIGHLWRRGKLLHRHDGYADLAQGGDPFWDAIGREDVIS
jgi:broad specificity phosphatase PhoE